MNNLNKKFFALFLILALVGCNKNISGEDRNKTEIGYSEGIYVYSDEISFNKTPIPDKESAVNIAEAILLNFQNQGYFLDCIVQTVFYDTENNVWIISFWEDNNGVGACFSIALKADNAEIIKMWVGE